MKSPGERGPIGAWAYDARAEAALSVPQVIDELAARGLSVRDSTIRGIESGSKRPGRRLLRLLSEIYGSRPPGEEPTPPEDLAGAIRSLAVDLIAEAYQRGFRDGLAAGAEGQPPP